MNPEETATTEVEPVSETENPEQTNLEENQETVGDGQQSTEEKTEENVPAESSAPKKRGAEKRIRQLTRKYRDEQRQREQLQARLDALEKRIGPEPEPPRPSRDNYETTEEYEDDLFEWRDKLKATKTEPEQVATAPVLDDAQAEVIETFESELEELSPEAATVVMDEEWPCTTDMTDYIMSSEKRAELAYHLATHTDVADKISKMSPILAARELAKVESSLSDSNTGAQTTEPPPPPASTGKPSGSSLKDPEKMSTEQWVAERRRVIANR